MNNNSRNSYDNSNTNCYCYSAGVKVDGLGDKIPGMNGAWGSDNNLDRLASKASVGELSPES